MTKILLFSFLQIIINTILVTVHTILVKFSKEHWSIGNNNSKCKHDKCIHVYIYTCYLTYFAVVYSERSKSFLCFKL